MWLYYLPLPAAISLLTACEKLTVKRTAQPVAASSNAHGQAFDNNEKFMMYVRAHDRNASRAQVASLQLVADCAMPPPYSLGCPSPHRTPCSTSLLSIGCVAPCSAARFLVLREEGLGGVWFHATARKAPLFLIVHPRGATPKPSASAAAVKEDHEQGSDFWAYQAKRKARTSAHRI